MLNKRKTNYLFACIHLLFLFWKNQYIYMLCIYETMNVSFTNTYILPITISSSTIGMTYRKAIRAINICIYTPIDLCQQRG